MNKKSLIILALPLLISTLVSCNGSSGSSKTNLSYGKIHSTVPYEAESIAYDELQNKIETGENFALAISHIGCGCWTTFEPILNDFNYKHNLNIRYIDASEFEGNNKYGLRTYEGDMPSLAIFSNGTLKRQVIYTNNSYRSIFTDKSLKSIEKFFDQNVNYPKMYYIEKDKVDTFISSGAEFNLYVARNKCNDCNVINKTALKKWNNKVATVKNPLYIFDIQQYQGTDDYQTIKDDYGLSEKYNTVLGYGTGSVPTFQNRKGSKINDMTVVLNDRVNKETKIVSSYFTTDRVQNMPFLASYGDKYVLDGMKVSDAQAEKWSSSYEEESYQVKRHSEILNLFLNQYVK